MISRLLYCKQDKFSYFLWMEDGRWKMEDLLTSSFRHPALKKPNFRNYSILCTIVIVSIFTLQVFSQKAPRKSSVEVTVFGGGSYYIGDLNPENHFNKFTKPAGGIGVRFNHNTRLSTHGHILYGTIAGDDAASSSLGLRARNLNFKTNILECSVKEEFNFVDYRMGTPGKFFSPYTFVGLAFFGFNPKGEINGNWQSLQPLSTEGEGTSANPGSKKYKRFQVSVPFGVGFKVNLSERLDLAMEWGMRKTYTDYLDDVSTVYPDPTILLTEKGKAAVDYSDKSGNANNVGRQRGNSQNKDWYCFTGIILGFKLKEPTMPCAAFD